MTQFGNTTYTPAEVWESWVGNQGVDEFLSYRRPQQDIREFVNEYVDELDSMNVSIAAETLEMDQGHLCDEIVDGLVEYIEEVQARA